MKRRVLGVFATAVLSLATAGVALASPAAAVSECHSGTVPAVQAGQSNFRAQCNLEVADQSSRVQLSDYPFARWHSGSARLVTAKVGAGGVLTAVAPSVFLPGDVNHTITAAGVNQTCSHVPARAFIKATTATTATLSSATGLILATRTPATVAGAKGLATQLIASAAGTPAANAFQACDVGRVVSGTGVTVGTKVTSFISAKLVGTSVATPVAATTLTMAPLVLTFQVDNTVARTTQDGVIANTTTTLTSATMHFINSASPVGDVGNTISGQCIPLGTTITAVGSATSVTISNPATCDQLVGDSANKKEISVNLPDGATSSARIVNDATGVAGKFHSPTANFQATDIGQQITKGAVKYLITAVTATDATTTPVAPAFAVAAPITVGTATVTAPVNGDLVAQQATSLQLLTSLVGGSPPCGTRLTGTTIDGAWYNPGGFLTSGILGATTGPPVQVAEIVFPTSVTSFAAFLTPRPAGSPFVDESGHAETQTAAHYDITYPFEPLGIAVCPATTVSSDWTFVGTTLGTQKLPTGTGMPSSSIARGIQAAPTALAPQTAYIASGPGGNPDLAGDPCTIDPAIALTTFATAFPCGV